jgi:malate synthase
MEVADHAVALRTETPAPGEDAVLTPDALAFVVDLHVRFGARRTELLAARVERQARLDAGELPGFRPDTADIRSGTWTVRSLTYPDFQDRRVEITGPVDRKMMINALNSGAKTFMADFEDSNSPTWGNLIEGQQNLMDALRGTIELVTDAKTYVLSDDPATLIVRPRGWHLPERHVEIDGAPGSGSLFDFGLYAFHNLALRAGQDLGLYLYLPKLESAEEARLWADVFRYAEDRFGVPRGTIRATVLIETILAAFEMDEILWELRDHSAGLNAGRWDYIFSVIKKFRNDPTRLLPDRAQITMTVPFMRAYTELLVATCHRRGAFAMGGMSAFIPNRREPEVTARALEAVRADKRREAADGCDGTWVAHPDLVPVVLEIFDEVLGDRPNQIGHLRDDVHVVAADLIDVSVPDGRITEDGIRTNVNVGIQYLASWLCGNGAAAINNLMEDAATAEISRSQIWQWVTNGAVTDDGIPVTANRVRAIAAEELARIEAEVGEAFTEGRFDEAAALFERVALDQQFPEFLTLPAYERIN